MKHICQICQKEINSFSHFKKAHKILFKDYYDKFIKKDNEGICIICGKESKWHNKIILGRYYDITCGGNECKRELSLRNLLNTKQYWMSRGFSEKESEIQISKIQKSNVNKFVEKLKDKNYKKQFLKKSNISIDFWINQGFTEEEAKEKVTERQRTFTKEKCIEKYGKEEGLKRWQERQNKWQNTLKSKPENERIEIEKRRLKRNGYTVSLAEKQIIKIIQDLYKINLEDQKILFRLGKRKKYVYDFCLEQCKKIIEYNGDFWHCNPEIYSPNYYNPVIKMTSKQKWKKDKEKINFAKDNGYSVLVVWERDFKYEKDKTIEKIINFLKGD